MKLRLSKRLRELLIAIALGQLVLLLGAFNIWLFTAVIPK